MGTLGNGLSAARHHEDALLVREAALSMERRLFLSRTQHSRTCSAIFGPSKPSALQLKRDVYYGTFRSAARNMEGPSWQPTTT